MKKILTLLFILLLGTGVNAFENVTIEEMPPVNDKIDPEDIAHRMASEAVYDWFDIDVARQPELIEKYKKILFSTENNGTYYSKEEFKQKFAPYFKDKDFKHHYMLTNNGVTEDEDAKYCAFYYKKNTLVMYAIQYKKNPHNAFYYTAFGKLYYTDITSENYPQYPYYSMQYSRNGKLKSAIYFISKDIQYMYTPDGEFQGIWYKDKMYDKDGKQIMTRTNW